MSNALVNRIKQRFLAQRQFMRSVFAAHHTLVWNLTNAPSLRALGLTPKRSESNLGRTFFQAREIFNNNFSRAVQEDIEAFEEPRLEVLEQPIELQTNAEFMPELNVEQNLSETAFQEAVSEEITSERNEIQEVVPFKLNPQRAREILERSEPSVTSELRTDVAASSRRGEIIPPDISPRANEMAAAKTEILSIAKPEDISNLVSEIGTQTVQTNLDETITESREAELIDAVENQEIQETESQAVVIDKVIQNVNHSNIEQTKQPETTIQTSNSKPQSEAARVARAFEVLSQRGNIDIPQNVDATQNTEPTREVQNTKPTEEVASQNTALEAGQTNSETQAVISETPVASEISRDNFKPEVRAANQETASGFKPTKNQSQESEASFDLSPQVISKIKTIAREAIQDVSNQEYRTPEIRETVSEQALSQEVRETFANSVQESVAIQVQESSPEGIPETVAIETIPEFASREISESVTQSIPESVVEQQTLVARETVEAVVQETQTVSETLESKPEPEQANWTRSMPGEPQSGVVEIIRAKPPRNFRPANKTEARETTPEPVQTEESLTAARLKTVESLKALQQRYGNPNQIQSESFAWTAESSSTDTTVTPGSQKLADIAKRLVNLYNPPPENQAYTKPNQNSSAQTDDPRVSQSLRSTQAQVRNTLGIDTQPLQLQESTRNFLLPLIGFDPSQASIFVGPLATNFTSSLNADGATVATDVYLNNGFEEQTPEGLGLLAHELTHVGQNLDVAFVPPMLQTDTSQNNSNQSPETQARIVEARVTNTANRFVPAISLDAQNLDSQPLNAPLNTMNTPNLSSNDQPDAWDGLPAPWEAMPSFTNQTRSTNQTSSSTPSTNYVTPAPVQSYSDVQLAEVGRDEAGSQDNADPGAPATHQPPAQDMDAMAQQVYEILKRRLSSERRRVG